MDHLHRRAPDYWLILPVIALAGLGLVMVYSASSIVAGQRYGDPAFFLKRQVLWVLLGSAALGVARHIHYPALRRLTPVLLAAGIGLLVLVLIPGIGRVAGGARRWITVGGAIAFQPSESFKVILALYLANFLTHRGPYLDSWRGMLPPVVVTATAAGLILLQPDLGTAMLLGLLTVTMLFVAGVRLRHLAALAVPALGLLALAIGSAEYRRRRILAFLDPWADAQGAGFHIIQSLLALGSGGVLGVGLGGSRQKFFYLPERHTDFIFSILGEELGLVGTGGVVLLFGLFALRGYRVARRAPDRYGSLLAAALTTMILIQAIINIGVTSGVLPITGVPLPWVSFGGSSMLFTMIAVGILLNISQYGRDATAATGTTPPGAAASDFAPARGPG
ncbi:MAG: putative lipid II flippase FtsW [Armatimonadota bacterium]|nr:putative lipid II flippase FtsW [Armatimonadota bacterium]MDR7451751.1 putative lipid II flippase FtsW [Armatimonadota bacterium]MDR7467376.1 putative lipid II flippase FtsW [Armatimonadota bacterium]MDR7494146.1 putative lipid II flippase FtsW [Armatimonadota bacterium]MDR7498888.1 putative lipid II flippase FtsW [Armatimonadota bacterium]